MVMKLRDDINLDDDHRIMDQKKTQWMVNTLEHFDGNQCGAHWKSLRTLCGTQWLTLAPLHCNVCNTLMGTSVEPIGKVGEK